MIPWRPFFTLFVTAATLSKRPAVIIIV
jgi:hypothetical protein